MVTRTFAMLLALSLLTFSSSAFAQNVGPRVGVIPGTNMTRDEFRARAQANLAAVALNAVAYFVANGAYPPDFYALQTSPAWNIDVKNMFNGRNLQAVYFEPTPEDMTTDPYVGMNPFEINTEPQMGADDFAKRGPDGQLQNLKIKPAGGPMRVDPDAIRDFEGGEIFYYTRGEMLQLIIFAPDGSYIEWFDPIPNGNFRSSITLRDGQPAENVYAAQVLYYVDSLAPQHYNLVRFMADEATVPGAQLATLPGSKKIELASRIEITVLNPVTRKPLTAAKECSPGIILEGSPLKVCTAKGPSLSLTEMTLAREDPQLQSPAAKQKAKQTPKPKPGQRPPGGRTPGAPGGGRR